MRQAISGSRLLKIVGITFVLLTASIHGDRARSVDTDATVDELIAQLSSSLWAAREQATEALLRHGADAVEKLRPLQTHGDPEIRTRARYILEQIDPWVYDVRVCRLAPPSAEHPDARLTGFSSFRLKGGGGGSAIVPMEFDSDDPERAGRISLVAKAIGEGSPLSIAITFGREQNSVTELRTLEPGAVAILRHEDHLETRVSFDDVQRSVESIMWVVEFRRLDRQTKLARGSEAATDPTLARAESELFEAIDRVMQSDSDRTAVGALEVLGWMGSALPGAGPNAARLLARARDIETSASDRVRLACRLALMQAGDAKATSSIEAWLESPIAPDEDRTRDQAAIALTRRGSSAGLDELLARVAEMPSWLQYRAMQTLIDRWDSPGFSDFEVEQIFTTFTAPEVFTFLPWYTDGVVRTLFRAVVDAVPVEKSRPVILESLTRASSTTSGGVFRVRALLAAVKRLHASGRLDVVDWLEPVVDAMADASVTRNALKLIRELIIAGPLDDDVWDILTTKFEEAFAGENQALMRNLDNSINEVLAAPEVSSETKRRLWRIRVGRLPALEGKLGHLRRQVDVQLVKKFGPLEARAPQPKASPAWAARAEEWLARLEEADDATFQSTPGEERYWYVEVELNVELGQPVEVLRFDRYELRPNLAVQRNDPGVASATLLLEAYATSPISRTRSGYAKRFLLARRTVYLDVPTISRTSVRGRRVHRFTMAEGDYRPRALPMATTTQFRTLSWLRAADNPSETWEDLVAALVEGCTDELVQRRNACRKVIADVRIEEALPRLQALYEAEPSSGLAITLLQLGDYRGRRELLEGLEKKPPADAVAVLKALVLQGDEEALQLLLSWITKPPARLQRRGLLQTLEEFARAHPDRVEEGKWIETIVSVLDQRNLRDHATRILRRITGEDFGFSRRHQQYPDAKKRTAAEKEMIQSWRQWYERYGDQRSKSPRD